MQGNTLCFSKEATESGPVDGCPVSEHNATRTLPPLLVSELRTTTESLKVQRRRPEDQSLWKWMKRIAWKRGIQEVQWNQEWNYCVKITCGPYLHYAHSTSFFSFHPLSSSKIWEPYENCMRPEPLFASSYDQLKLNKNVHVTNNSYSLIKFKTLASYCSKSSL